MTTGTIKKLVSDRGFGFITAEDGKEYFFHRSAIENFDSLRGNERVEFDVEDSPKGPRAAQVRVSQGAPVAAAPAPAPAAEAPVAEAAVAEEPAAEEPAEESAAEASAEEPAAEEAEAEHSDVQ
jgi:CspA family cold shock protein